MFNRVARFVLAVALIAGCGSSSDPGSGGELFLRFNANGTSVEYTVQASLFASFAQSGAQYNALFTGYDASSNASLNIFSGAAIAVGTYSGYDITGGALVGVQIVYEAPSGMSYSSGGGAGASDATITITEMTATRVRGTFSGTLSAAGQPDVAATSGEFFLQRAN